MKWSTAVRKLSDLAEAAGELATSPAARFSLPVTQLWAAAEILGPVRDELDRVVVAVVADVPDVPWLTAPDGAEHWARMTRLSKNPIFAVWRSAASPVWNHFLERPVLFWDRSTGVDVAVLDALRDGRAEEIRPALPSAAELSARLEAELAVSLAALRDRTRIYDERRWGRGGLPAIADPLFEASTGYLDVLDALG